MQASWKHHVVQAILMHVLLDFAAGAGADKPIPNSSSSSTGAALTTGAGAGVTTALGDTAGTRAGVAVAAAAAAGRMAARTAAAVLAGVDAPALATPNEPPTPARATWNPGHRREEHSTGQHYWRQRAMNMRVTECIASGLSV